VGLFVLVGLVLFTGALVVLGGGDIFKKPVLFETYLNESVQGLEVGSPVKYRGVQLGSVSRIGLVGDSYRFESLEDELKYGGLVMLEMALLPSQEPAEERTQEEQQERLEKMIDRGLRLRLTSQGITGLSYIEADYLSPKSHPPMHITWTPKNRYVPSTASTLKGFTSAVERIFARLENLDIERVVTHLDELLVRVTEGVAQLEIGDVTAEVQTLLRDLRATSTGFRRAVDDAEVQTLAASARDAFDELNGTLANVQGVIESSSYDLEIALENLRVVTEDLRDVSSTAKSYPSFILLGQPPKESEVVSVR
jgi:phospholipid/cholesterol/gamma-HCH transport system substrate-binding protein/paraquat-inducible protein B